MIQTTLFSYLACNDDNEPFKQQPIYNKSPLSFKQTNLTQYFKTIPKKKNLILNYFKPKEKKEKEKVFDLMLVDIKKTEENWDITCIKKNMYDPDLKYIAISYRWGEIPEQLIKTPDYIAHITSFYVNHFIWLCGYIKNDPNSKDIPYLWIDAISIDQHNHSKKKETILKMSDIYKNASYILAVPDLHLHYLLYNTANYETINIIGKYRYKIYDEIYNYNNNNNNDNDNDNDNSKDNSKDSDFNSTDSINDNDNDKPKDSDSNSTDPINDHHDSPVQKLTHNTLMNENEELKKEIKEMKLKNEKEELKKAYLFLAYLMNDWSNRAWVISEHQIAKQKYKLHGTPLKFTFLSLLLSLNNSYDKMSFFSYNFFDQNDEQSNRNHSQLTHYSNVEDSYEFIRFLKLRFTQRNHMEMMLGSNASRNEDRFYAILPSWNKYKHLVKNKNTIFNWNINDMVSVKLKLYEIMNSDGNLWDKARLLLYSSFRIGKPVLPSFASYYEPELILAEIDHIELIQSDLVEYLSEFKDDAKQYVDDYIYEHGTILKQSLVNIQYKKQSCSLSIKVNKYFVFDRSALSFVRFNVEELSYYSLRNSDSLQLVYIPYFTYDIPEYSDIFPLDEESVPYLAGIFLLGNYDTNKWILTEYARCHKFGKPSLQSIEDDYVFNIY